MRIRLAVMAAVFLVCVAGNTHSATAAEPPAGRPLDRLLRDAGHSRVPLRTDPAVPLLSVKARCGTRDLTLLVDTGATTCVLDVNIASNLGLKPVRVADTIPVLGGLGGKLMGSITWVSGVRVGNVELPPFHWLLLDLGHARAAADAQQPGASFDGLIGTSLLQYFQSVVDIDGPALYLLDPSRQEKGLQGEWQGVAVCRAGAKDIGEHARTWRLRVDGLDARLHSPDGAADYKLAWKLSANPKELTLHAPDGSSRIQAVYRQSGDELTVAAAFRAGDDFSKRPTSVDPPANGGYTVVTYKRVRPAVPDKR